MLNKQRVIQIGLVIIDMIIVLASGWCSLAMRFDIVNIPGEYLATVIQYISVDMVVTISVFWIFRLYHGVWTFISVEDVTRTFQAVVVISIIEFTYKNLAYIDLPRSYYLLNFIFLFFMVIGTRVSLRFINYYRHRIFHPKNQKRTMIVGAGAAGVILLRELKGNRNSENKVVCFIDDNPNKKNKYIKGIRIVGGRFEIKKAIEDFKVEEIIIAMPSVKPSMKSKIVEICNSTDCSVKVLPFITSSLKGGLYGTMRDADIQDLIGRNPIKVNQEGIGSFISGQTVLVTGGGGSIGSEICRQVMKHNPKKLIIFDIYENNAYSLQQELLRTYDCDKIDTLIGSVRDYDRMRKVFEEYSPDIVYHAAAHKHVPLMEDSPAEAIKNNCSGTLNVAGLSNKYGVKNFILISTDKAVRPTNVMGATKRICELIIQYYNKKSDTRYAAVRFGNVLGSNGSVVPLFLKQIEEGGPVTVTHPEITRFFMTIPEAVSLVLQASLYAKGGEIFVLNMGKPVKIHDLARNLIKQKGYKPGEDMEIKFVGLRPGEKLYEEILMDEEGLRKTENELIFIGNPIDINFEEFWPGLMSLIKLSQTNAPSGVIKEKVREVCTTYKMTGNMDNVLELEERKVGAEG